MLRLLVPVEENETREAVITSLIHWLKQLDTQIELHLLNVQPAMSSEVGMFVSTQSIHAFQREEGMKQLTPAMEQLQSASITFHQHICVGDVADIIMEFAHEKGIHQIVMGYHSAYTLTALLLGSIPTRVMQASDIPVMLIR